LYQRQFQTLEKTYQIREEIGQGATARVLDVVEKETGKQYAAKCFFVEEELALHEIWILGKIHDPMAPAVKDIVLYENRLCMIMERVGGIALEQLLDQARVPFPTILNWTRQLCFFLDYLHHLKEPVVYCDLKPENIMILPNGNLKLVDFGAARFLQDSHPRQGTPQFAAPELWDEKTPVGIHTDMYTIGRMLHYLMERAKPGSILKRYQLRRIEERCCRKKYRRRFSSMREVMKALEKV